MFFSVALLVCLLFGFDFPVLMPLLYGGALVIARLSTVYTEAEDSQGGWLFSLTLTNGGVSLCTHAHVRVRVLTLLTSRNSGSSA